MKPILEFLLYCHFFLIIEHLLVGFISLRNYLREHHVHKGLGSLQGNVLHE